MDSNQQKTSQIYLKDVLRFDNLRGRFPNKRIKLRFNTSWKDKNEKGEQVLRDYRKMYESGDPFFFDSILSQKENRRRLSSADIVFQFIEVSYHKWLLIDAMNITKDIERRAHNPLSNRGFNVAGGVRLSEYTPFFGRLTVDWTNKPQQFFYVDQELVDNVEVYEISTHAYLDRNDDFVGYENVCKSYVELRRIIDNKDWKEALRSVYGVYAITDKKTGKLYVCSAYGANGIYGRWLIYLNSGFDKDEKETGEHPNKKLKTLVLREGMAYIAENFQYTILEIFQKNELGKARALKRESYWKEILHTRSCGYNDN